MMSKMRGSGSMMKDKGAAMPSGMMSKCMKTAPAPTVPAAKPRKID
jgi:hypothetical protein